ncbi:hypothetical protein Ddye_009214 [Dipteronia dyeriana]|uniref:Uncharacterized protein n=1 Tax=Dipteronia dyeriana TaxID=168575 RepID=A0AAD9XBC2_9ROSI|nr:hypothetical protein Ddye_009214 [Dipteronia dyeriana]
MQVELAISRRCRSEQMWIPKIGKSVRRKCENQNSEGERMKVNRGSDILDLRSRDLGQSSRDKSTTKRKVALRCIGLSSNNKISTCRVLHFLSPKSLFFLLVTIRFHSIEPELRIEIGVLFFPHEDEQIMDGKASTQLKCTWKKMGDEERKVAVNYELKRMNQLPANSSYVIHRLRVLNKILQLISLQRTASQEEELELLFSGLSI